MLIHRKNITAAGLLIINKVISLKLSPSMPRPFEINPNYRDAYINRGNAYCNQGKFAQAISDFTKATEIDKKSLEAYYNRGNVYYYQGNSLKP